MLENFKYTHPDRDRGQLQQQAFMRYRHIKRLKESERSLDDKLFLENFEAAMGHLWSFQKIADSLVVDSLQKSADSHRLRA
jgi:hypothetical protein